MKKLFLILLNFFVKIFGIKNIVDLSALCRKALIVAEILLLTIIACVNSSQAANGFKQDNSNFLSTQAASGFKHGISVFGNLKYSTNFQNFDYVNPTAPKGGTVKFGMEGSFNSLNPFILKGLSAAGLDSIYDSLTEGADDEIASRYGLIAESMQLSSDKFSLSFKLRKAARWHDSRPITADDIIFTFNKLLEEGHPSYKIAYSQVLRVEKINNYEVKFIFKTNQSRDLPLLVASMKILPKHYYEDEKHQFNQTTLEPPLGSGPYKIKSVEQGKNISYELVENYWGRELPVNKGRNNFAQISYDYYRDSNVLIEAFKAGKFDFRQENISRNWFNSYNIDKVKNGEIIKREIKHSLPTATQTFALNLRREKFQDINFRKALTYAFNFEWLRQHIFYGAYQRTESYFANSNFAYNAQFSVQEKSVLKPFHLPKSDSAGFGRENLIIAKKILDDAGYKIIDGKLISPTTQNPVTIEFLVDSKTFEMVIAPFVKNLHKLGITAKTRFVEENQYEARVRNFDYDIIVAVFGQSLIPGNELLRYWHSSQKTINGSQNLVGLDNKEVDALIEKITKSQNAAELTQLCRQLDKHLLENYYTIPQWHNGTYRALYRDIFAMPKITPKYSLGTDTWWIRK